MWMILIVFPPSLTHFRTLDSKSSTRVELQPICVVVGAGCLDIVSNVN